MRQRESIADRIERKRRDLRSVRKDMAGISPRTETYKKLEAEAQQIQQHIDDLELARTADDEESYYDDEQ